MLAAADARICRVHLSGPEGSQGEVRAALEGADWGAVATLGDVVFLRRVRVAGPLRGLGRLAVRETRAAAAGAVDGFSPEADRAAAVRFASRASLLACLLRDLLFGRADRRWFWRSLGGLAALPPAAAAPRLLAAEPHLLPAVCEHLSGETAWPRLWEALGDAGARQVLAAVQRATGWRVAVAEARAEPEPETSVAGLAPGLLPRAWRAALPARVGAADGRLWLSVVVRLWQTCPRALVDAPGVVRALAAAIARGDSGAPLATREGPVEGKAPGREEPEIPRAPGAPRARTGDPRGEPEPTATAGVAGRAGPAAEHPGRGPGAPAKEPPEGAPGERLKADRESSWDQEPALRAARTRSPEGARAEPAAGARAGRERAQLGETRLVTRKGGWFLLLNALALPAAQDRLRAEADPPGVAAGWVWLYRLGRRLGAEPDPALARFFAREAGLADPDGLAALAPLRAEPELVRLGSARFGAAVFDAGLVDVPALVVSTTSHLDVHYRMADARIEVRRAALDVNPGWLPWLGRVASFHYGELSELAGLRGEEPEA